MVRGMGLAVHVVFITCLLGVRLDAATASQKSPALDKAIAELKREYAAHGKNPGGAHLRENCDYFKKGPPIPADAVLAALEKPVAGVSSGDGRQCAYVKWQLLSALPEKPDDAAVKRLLKVYERAPIPAPRFGTSSQEQKQLDALLQGVRNQDDVRLNATIDEAVGRQATADGPIIAFRDELYRRLPKTRDTFIAAMMDAHARVTVAADKDKLAEALSDDLTAWALTAGADKTQVRAVAELVGKLRFVESAPYYAYASVRSGKLAWRTRTDALLTKAKFAALHKALLDAAGVGGPLPDDPAAAARPAAARQPAAQQQTSRKPGSTKESKKAGNSS